MIILLLLCISIKSTFIVEQYYTASGLDTAYTGYEVTFTINSQELISNGELRGDCKDIAVFQVLNLEEKSLGIELDWWAESICGEAKFTIWVSLPTDNLPEIHFCVKYNDPGFQGSSKELVWAGSFLYLKVSNSDECGDLGIGWSDFDDSHDRYLKIDQSFGVTGEGHSHSYDFYSISIDESSTDKCTEWTGGCGSSDTNMFPDNNHRHRWVGSVSTFAADVPHTTVRLCKAKSANAPSNVALLFDIPVASIIGLDSDAVFEGRFLKAGAFHGVTSDTNTMANHQHVYNDETSMISMGDGDWYCVNTAGGGSTSAHTFFHKHQNMEGLCNTAPTSAPALPQYGDVVFKVTSIAHSLDELGVPVVLLIDNDEIPPLGYERFASMDGKYLRGGVDDPGYVFATGGNSQPAHDHDFNFVSTRPGGGNPQDCSGSASDPIPCSDFHTHTFQGSTSSDATQLKFFSLPAVKRLVSPSVEEYEFPTCNPPDCSSHGSCEGVDCECQQGWNVESTCSTCDAAHFCNSRGDCDTLNGVPCTCTEPGWQGDSCEIPSITEDNDDDDSTVTSDNDNDNDDSQSNKVKEVNEGAIVAGVLIPLFVVFCIAVIIAAAVVTIVVATILRKKKLQDEDKDGESILTTEGLELSTEIQGEGDKVGPALNMGMKMKQLLVPVEKIKIVRRIDGKSDVGVYEAKWKSHQGSVAYKVFQTRMTDFQQLERELEISMSINHPNILRFFGITAQAQKIGIVMEFGANGDLRGQIIERKRGNNPFSADQKIRIMLGIASGCAYLHGKSIIHRDIKSSNILLDIDFVPKLMDFGISRVKSAVSDMTRRIGFDSNFHLFSQMSRTTQYMAPEMTMGKKYDEKVDIFSLAIVFYELYFETTEPYGSLKDLDFALEFKVANTESFRPKIEEGKYDKEHQWLMDLMEKMWSHDQETRPSASEVVDCIGH